jgi:hypothetical protein
MTGANEPVGASSTEGNPFAADPFDEDDPPGGSDGFASPAGLAIDPPDLFVSAPPPSGDADWTSVTPVAPSEAPFSMPSEPDPFSIDLGPDLLTLGHFVDSRTHGVQPPSGDGLASAAVSVHQAAYPALFDGAPPPNETPRPTGPEEDPETAFHRALTDAFARRAATPFLVLALRLAPAGPHADLLPAVAHGLDTALGDDGALFGVPAAGRLVALLPGSGSEATSGLFAAVRAHLHAVAPNRAAEALALRLGRRPPGVRAGGVRRDARCVRRPRRPPPLARMARPYRNGRSRSRTRMRSVTPTGPWR